MNEMTILCELLRARTLKTFAKESDPISESARRSFAPVADMAVAVSPKMWPHGTHLQGRRA
jgi:hypothetical protein